MNLSSITQVQRLSCDLVILKGIDAALDQTRSNSRYIHFSTGYFQDGVECVQLKALETDPDAVARIAVSMATAAKCAVATEIAKLQSELKDLGVNPDK